MVEFLGTKLEQKFITLYGRDSGNGDAIIMHHVWDRIGSAMPTGKAPAPGLTTIGNIPIYHTLLAPSPSPCPTPFTELKNKVLINPDSIDAGLVLSAKQYTLVVWWTGNRFTRMTAWSLSSLDNVTMSNSDGYPCAYAPGQSRSYDVVFQATGQAQVDGTIRFLFQGTTVPAVEVTGTRLIAWNFEPTWSEPIAETLEWGTDVIPAYDGSEQRIRLRQNPRRSISYQILFDTPQKAQKLINQLYGWQQRVWAVPVWTDWVNLGTSVAIGAQTLSISTANRDFNPGQLVMLWLDSFTYEIAELQTVSANSVTLVKPLNNAWSTRTRVVPCRLGRLGGTVNLTYHTGRVLEGVGMTFSFEPKTAVGSNRLGTSPYTTMVDGYPILTVAIEPEESLTLNQNQTVIDFEQGAWTVYAKPAKLMSKRTLRWVLKGRPAISDFIAWLEYCKGRLNSFWLPSWTQDVSIQGTFASVDTSLTIAACDYTKFVSQHPNRNRLVFIKNDRSMFVRKITGSSDNGATEILSLDSAIGIAGTENSAFGCVSFLLKCRLDEDKAVLRWHSQELLECEIPVVELPL